MESKFTTYFILTRSLFLLIALVFFVLPLYIYFSEHKGCEKESMYITVFLFGAVSMFLYVIVKNYTIVKIELTAEKIQLWNVLRRKAYTYQYADVERMDLLTYGIEGYTKSGTTRIVNYEERVTLHLKDGFAFIIGAEVYLNYKELYRYINEKTGLNR